MEGDYKLSTKINGKWRTFGNLKKNQYDNYQVSLKNTPELKALINSETSWVNFSLFPAEDKPKEGDHATPETRATLDNMYKEVERPMKPLDDTIPF